MPTGYTADIAKGISFQQYALNCARAFGALVTMRDEPSDAPIPEKFEPSSYNLQALEKAKDRMAALERMTAEEASAEATAAFLSEKKRWQECIDEAKELRRKYDAMLADVRKWKPPTPDHEGLRDFMEEQIQSSYKFDCSTDYYEKNPPVCKTTESWRADEMAEAGRDIAYHTEAHAEEVERALTRTAWVAALRSSI